MFATCGVVSLYTAKVLHFFGVFSSSSHSLCLSPAETAESIVKGGRSPTVPSHLPLPATPCFRRACPSLPSRLRLCHTCKTGGFCSDYVRVTSSLLFPVQNLFPRRAKGRARGSTELVGGAGGGVSAGFSSHSHAKFVSQLMRESRFRVSEGRKGGREQLVFDHSVGNTCAVN